MSPTTTATATLTSPSGTPSASSASGTTVTWEWTGQGSIHNVVAQYGADFASKQKSEEGATYKQTFNEPGTVLYVCVPHEGLGMKGAVIVE